MSLVAAAKGYNNNVAEVIEEEQEDPQEEESNVPVLGSGPEPRKVRGQDRSNQQSSTMPRFHPMWYCFS